MMSSAEDRKEWADATELIHPESAPAPHRRLRWAMHGALAAVAVLFAAAGYTVWTGERGRLADAELISLAGGQRMLSQRIAFLGALRPVSDDDALELALQRSQREAGRIEELLGVYDDERMRAASVELRAAITRWEGARERRWFRAEALQQRELSLQEAGDAFDSGVARALHIEAESMQTAAEGLVTALQHDADDKAATAMRRLAVIAAVASSLLLGLGLLVAEPTIRSLGRQHTRLQRQAEELARLALVAERTHNAVVITDADRRIAWANDAFMRVSGYSLAEIVGRKPAELLQCADTAPETIARLRASLDAGRGSRVELLNRNKHGVLYWMDIDIQPLHGPSGALAGFIAVETDITEQVSQRRHLRSLLDALPAGVVVQDTCGTIIDANAAAETILGLSRDQLFGRHSVDESWQAVREDLSPYPAEQHPSARSLRDGVSVRAESLGIVTPEGQHRWLVVNSEPLRDPAGAVTGVVACFVDVTDRRDKRILLQLALQAAAIGTWEWRVDTGERTWSPQSCAMLGYTVAEFGPLVNHWRDLIHPDDRKVVDTRSSAHLANPVTPFRCDMRVRHRLGHWVWMQVFGTVVERDANGVPCRVVGLHLDIGDRKAHEQELKASALSDPLTGLPNRLAMMDRLKRTVAQHRRQPGTYFAVLFLDFDRFKQVNDRHGHAAGDFLLRQIAARLTGTLRPGDAVATAAPATAQTAARLGGDEFVVLLEGLRSPAEAGVVADRLLGVLADPYEYQGHVLYSTASIGIVTSAQPFENADTLLRDADAAMYEAKRAGRGRWVLFDPGMHQKTGRQASRRLEPSGTVAPGDLPVTT